MGYIPENIDVQMQGVLKRVTKNACPEATTPPPEVIRHVWRDADYVGVASGAIAVWRGWSVNLKACNPSHGTLYIDHVENTLSATDQLRLFGEAFSSQIAGMSSFVFCFVTSFPYSAKTQLATQGFVVRQLPKRIHAGILSDAATFGDHLTEIWANQAIQLLNIQSTFRKVE